MTRIAVIGPNDEGLRLGVALQSAGADVVGFDLAPAEYSPIPLAHNITEASTADVVLSFVSPHLAEKTAQEVAPLLQAGAIYADFTTGTPELKKRLAQHFPDHAFTDASLAAGTIEAAGPAAQLDPVSGALPGPCERRGLRAVPHHRPPTAAACRRLAACITEEPCSIIHFRPELERHH